MELTYDQAINELLDGYGIPSIDVIKGDPVAYIGRGSKLLEDVNEVTSMEPTSVENPDWKWLPITSKTHERMKFMCRFLDPEQKLNFDQAVNELLDAYGIPTVDEFNEDPGSYIGLGLSSPTPDEDEIIAD